MGSGAAPSPAQDLGVHRDEEAPPVRDFREVKAAIVPFAQPLKVLEFEMEPLGPPLAVWLPVGPRIPPGVGSPERRPLALELVELATLGDQASPLGDRLWLDALG